jgi:hypothetical protein
VSKDRLSAYRERRDRGRTPEPVPEQGPLPRGHDDTFVIQEHHARRLHWDFRLERDGVLVIVDEEPTSYNVVGCAGMNWSSQGSFSLTQGTDSSGVPISVIDTHQLGAGFGGHLFFTHNRAATDTSHLVTGTWKVSLPTQVYHVLAHVPSTGGTTRSAHYTVTASDGNTYDRVVDQYQQQDQWAGVGFFSLGANAQVTLKNVTDDAGYGAHDVAFDGLAFVPVPGSLVTHTLDAVSMIDKNQDLNSNIPTAINTPTRTMTTLHDWAIEFGRGGAQWNDHSQSHSGVANQPMCAAGAITSSCVPANVWNVGSKWAQDATDAGTGTTGHVAGMTEPIWLGYANSTPPPATLSASTFSDDQSFKVRSHLDISFVVSGGKIVPGSQDLHFRERTGTTHVADYVVNFMKAPTTGSRRRTSPTTSTTPICTPATPRTSTHSIPEPLQHGTWSGTRTR